MKKLEKQDQEQNRTNEKEKKEGAAIHPTTEARGFSRISSHKETGGRS